MHAPCSSVNPRQAQKIADRPWLYSRLNAPNCALKGPGFLNGMPNEASGVAATWNFGSLPIVSPPLLITVDGHACPVSTDRQRIAP